MVSVGSQAPVVPVPAHVPGESEPCVLSLDAYRDAWVVLVFYPRDFTFVCPTELQALAELEDESRPPERTCSPRAPIPIGATAPGSAANPR